MKKTLLYSVIALVLVLGLIIPVTVMASESNSYKHRDPNEEPYDIGDTIYYVMNVTNPETNTAVNTYTRIWDTLPNDVVIEFLGTSETLVLEPGESATYNASYIVRAIDLEWVVPPVEEPYWGVRNVFQAEGVDDNVEDIEDLVEDVAEVIPPPPPVGGEAFPVGKLSILVPWIVLGAAIVSGATIFVRRRRVQN